MCISAELTGEMPFGISRQTSCSEGQEAFVHLRFIAVYLSELIVDLEIPMGRPTTNYILDRHFLRFLCILHPSNFSSNIEEYSLSSHSLRIIRFKCLPECISSAPCVSDLWIRIAPKKASQLKGTGKRMDVHQPKAMTAIQPLHGNGSAMHPLHGNGITTKHGMTIGAGGKATVRATGHGSLLAGRGRMQRRLRSLAFFY